MELGALCCGNTRLGAEKAWRQASNVALVKIQDTLARH